jgi:hypothetical protein
MSDASSVLSFVRDALTDLGANVSGTGSLLWVQAPESLCTRLEVPPTFAITFDPERSGEFDAELVAPGSYFLEKLVALSAERGRWDAVRCVPVRIGFRPRCPSRAWDPRRGSVRTWRPRRTAGSSSSPSG